MGRKPTVEVKDADRPPSTLLITAVRRSHQSGFTGLFLVKRAIIVSLTKHHVLRFLSKFYSMTKTID